MTSPSAVQGTTVPLSSESRIITRQQLTDRDFYAQVKAGLLDGTVTALDQRSDSLTIGNETVPLTDQKAVRALAESQMGWVGVAEANPFLAGLTAQATKYAAPVNSPAA
jgi:hypothetical protein